MGNEMGNNNTSGLQEDNNTTAEAPEKSPQEIVHANNVEGENQVTPPAESKDYHEKLKISASDDKKLAEDTHVDDKKSVGREPKGSDDMKGENQVIPPAESRDYHEKVINSASDDPKEVVDSCVDDQKLKEREDTVADAPEESLQESFHHDDVKGEKYVISPAESTDYHEQIQSSASDDPIVLEDANFDNLKSGEREQKETEVHPSSSSNAADAPEQSLQEVVLTNDTKGENHVFLKAESKDYHENVLSSVSDDTKEVGDSCVNKQKSEEREQEETEVYPPSNSKAVDAPEKPLQDPLHEDDVEGENSATSPAESTDSNGDFTILASDDSMDIGDPCVDNNLSEQETEAYPPEHTKVAAKSNEGDDKDSELQPTSLSRDLEDHKESNLENYLGTRGPQLEKQTSIKRAEQGETTVPEPQKSIDTESDQYESAKVLAQSSIQDGSKFPQESESTLIMSLACHLEENADSSQTEVLNNLGHCAVLNSILDVGKKGSQLSTIETASQEEKPVCDVKSEIKDESEVGDSLRKVLDYPSGVEGKSNGELSTKMNLVRNGLSESLLEAIPLAKVLSNPQEVLEPEEKCMVLTEETKLIGKESENEENKHDHDIAQLFEECVNESKTEVSNASQAEAKFNVNVCKVDMCVNNQSEAPQEVYKGSEEEAVVAPGIGMVAAGSSDSRSEKEENIIEGERKEEAYYVIGNDTEKREIVEHCISQAPAAMSQSPIYLELPRDHKQDIVMVSDNAEQKNEPALKLKKENVASEFIATNAADLTAKTVVELAVEKPVQDLPPLAAKTAVRVAEIRATANQAANGVSAKDQILRFSCGSCETQSVGRSSTESNPDNLYIHAQMRKSPSFNLDLQIEVRKEESEQTQLLYQDKTAIESSSSQVTEVSFGNPVVHTGTDQDLLQFQAMPVEERIVTLETSDSEKSRTPFLGFLKEEEEANIVITPPKQENHGSGAKKAAKDILKSSTKEVHSTSSQKAKEKRKPRPFLFGTCMCCAAMIN